MHPYACDAAKAALCAHKQNKFAPAYEKFFAEQERLSKGQLPELITEAGLDTPAIQSCMSDSLTLSAVQKDIEEGINLSVNSTPTFYINGHKVEGALSLEVWYALIDRLLKK